MIGAVIVVIAAVAIGYAAWYESQLGRDERADRDFARRHRARPFLTADDRRINQVRRDPSPTRRRAS